MVWEARLEKRKEKKNFYRNPPGVIYIQIILKKITRLYKYLLMKINHHEIVNFRHVGHKAQHCIVQTQER